MILFFFLQMVMLVKKSKEYKTEVKYGEKETVLLGEEKDREDLIKQTGMLGKKGDAVWRYFLQIRITYTILKAQHFQNPTILIFIKLEAVFFFHHIDTLQNRCLEFYGVIQTSCPAQENTNLFLQNIFKSTNA